MLVLVLLFFRHDGKIDVFNNPIKKLLRVNHLRNISELKGVKGDLPEILLGMKAGDKKNLIKDFSGGRTHTGVCKCH